MRLREYNALKATLDYLALLLQTTIIQPYRSTASGNNMNIQNIQSISQNVEYEIIKLGYRYIDNGDGTINVCYDHAQDSYFNEYSWHHVARVREDENTYYISGEGDSCEGEYYKNDWTFADALINQCGVF